jgi:hypothetical protein
MYAAVRFAGTWARQKYNREIFKIDGGALALSLLCDSQNFYPVIYPAMNEKFERFETEGGRRASRRDKEKSSKPLENKGF